MHLQLQERGEGVKKVENDSLDFPYRLGALPAKKTTREKLPIGMQPK